jgi:hypothetical protein
MYGDGLSLFERKTVLRDGMSLQLNKTRSQSYDEFVKKSPKIINFLSNLIHNYYREKY